MSIIGTRPPLISETNLYELHHRARLAIKPGITGMWQVSGRSDITDFEEVVRLDKEYITNWNIGLDIYFFLLKRYPKLIAYFPKQILGMVRYKLHLSSKEEMKEMYFSFLKGVQTDKTFVDDFWKQNQNKIKEWYLNQKRKDDVIISASPEFLLKPICDILGMQCLLNEADWVYIGNSDRDGKNMLELEFRFELAEKLKKAII